MIGTHKTTVTTENGISRVTYHTTVIFEYDRNRGTVRLNSGGWQTATTKKRINQAFELFDLPWRVYQENFVWRVVGPNGAGREFTDYMALEV